MHEKARMMFDEGLNKVVALCTRRPSGPVLVDGLPWSGDALGEVAIVMSANNNVVRQHLRIARSCVDMGLDTVFVYAEAHSEHVPNPESYDVPGTRTVKLPLSRKRAGLSYPNPLVLLTMLAELDALFPRPPFKTIVTHIDQTLIFGLLVYWAKRRGITSVVVQEGMTVASDDEESTEESLSLRRRMRALAGSLIRSVPHPAFQYGLHYAVADYFCAYGETARREIVSLGRDPATVLVVGNPSFDHVTQLPAQRPVREKGRTALYAEQHIVEPEKELRFFDHLAHICCDHNGDRLIIKLHPWAPWKSEDVLGAISTSDARARLLTVTAAGDSADMLEDVDVLLTIHSTTAYHAFVKGVPVITINYLTKGYGELDAYRYGGALDVRDERDLERAVHDAMMNVEVRRELHEGAMRVISDHLYRLDGQASGRIAQALLDISRGSRPGSADGNHRPDWG